MWRCLREKLALAMAATFYAIYARYIDLKNRVAPGLKWATVDVSCMLWQCGYGSFGCQGDHSDSLGVLRRVAAVINDIQDFLPDGARIDVS